ncbi:uncharacterized protein [Aegilops tauschii subsp. strangulata]|uniref:uncharacterized protein n=1 Tax=Aegilops tauschii subsp. strangulata TaxID=200361 RepID=UPI003CC850EB
MDPSIQAFLDRLDATLVAHSTSIATIQAQTTKIDDLVAWRPDLEKRIAELGAAVTALQRERPSSTSAPTVVLPTEKLHSPHLATLGAPIGPEPGAGGVIHGSHDHGVFDITRGLPAASFRTPPPLPANGQSDPIPPTDSTVADYIEKFELIINHLSSYSDTIHPFYFLTRFVEGLRPDIRAVVLVQRPPDLDTACALALLQEEVADGGRAEPLRQHLPRPPEAQIRANGPLPLPPPPTRPNATAPGATDRRGTEAARVDTTKLKTLRDYRRARGLCFKCGEQWGHDHVCPTSVQLHVVEELLELFGIDSVTETTEQLEETVMAISRSAISGGVSAKAFQLQAWIQGREALMLVDSGSSTSFVNTDLAKFLEGVAPLSKTYRVRVADGGELKCSAIIPQCSWYTQGHEFTTDLKVLSLGVYDAILGMDWLEEHIPMTVDWKAKSIAMPSAQGVISLLGHEAESTDCLLINSLQLQGLCKNNAVAYMVQLHTVELDGEQSTNNPEALQQVIAEFPDLFEEPTELPPRRECDHHIPLIPGAQPFNVRPYRHKPEHKDEIERQVAELLRTGVIQRSNSPFASPVILVKKKDGTWRLCVDYRHLNAITCITKFPIPVIEELLDELHGACWFSKLDLRQAKPDRAASPGLLQPLPIPTAPWEMISMDFIDGLPQSAQFNCLLVIVDKRTKFAHFLPLAHPYTASKVALLYMNQIYKLHGLPGAIVSDRDPVFTSHFWQELFKHAGSELRLSTANHPQTDGQTERVNQCLETYLRCFTQACPKRWSYWIPMAQFWYNSSHHSAIERTVIQNILQQHLNRARQCMKALADKKRSWKQFEVGDEVYLKLQPYIQASVAPQANHKLSFKFFGPFPIIAKINDVAYKLQLPPGATVHPVIHVSLLRRALLPGMEASTHLPVEQDAKAVPVAILQTRWRKTAGAMIEQVQVQWSPESTLGTTWEDKAALFDKFPQAEAWGQASTQAGGMSASLPLTCRPHVPSATDQVRAGLVDRPRPTQE